MEVISPKLQEWKTRSEAVIIIEENGILEARPVSYSIRNTQEIEQDNIVAILTVETYREATKISKLYNNMINRGIRVQSLNNLVQAIEILGESQCLHNKN